MGAHNIKAKIAAKAYAEDHIADPTVGDAVTFTHSWNGSTDPSAAEGAALIADLDAALVATTANKAAIDAVLVVLEAWGLTKSS